MRSLGYHARVARVLLLLPTRSYRTPDFLAAASRLGVEVTVASEEPSTVQDLNPSGLLALDFRDPARCAEKTLAFARRTPIDAVVGVDEDTVVIAAGLAEALGLPHNPVEAVSAARHKPTMRERLAAAHVPAPRHRVFRREDGEDAASRAVSYPCVLKPTFLAGSRGVIRADDPVEFAAAWQRIGKILDAPDLLSRPVEAVQEILVEDFVPGAELAVEGILVEGSLKVLAIFDKPDPLDGPFFEETIYVTPSRLPRDVQESCRKVAADGARALGLRDGPIHAELRVNAVGVHLIEIAARSIGGLCARTLRFGTGISLEELILRHALGFEPAPANRQDPASGVMMIPIPRAGILEGVRGVEAAKAIPQIEEVTISAHPGQRLVPLPEGSRYLGFIFSRANTPERAEAALREAHARLEFRID